MSLATGELADARVHSQRLLVWAAAWPERTWAIEDASGLGHLWPSKG